MFNEELDLILTQSDILSLSLSQWVKTIFKLLLLSLWWKTRVFFFHMLQTNTFVICSKHELIKTKYHKSGEAVSEFYKSF